MAISLETQEIIFAFAIDNKDNYESWGKYELDELQDAYAEIPEEDRDSSAGQRIKERMEELASGHDQVKEARKEESSDPLDDGHEADETPEQGQEIKTEVSKQNTPIIIGGIIAAIIILLIGLYFFV